MSKFFSADVCLAQVVGKRARAYLSVAADIDRKEMAVSSTVIRAGSMEQARSVRAGDKQVGREGNDEGLGMGPGGGGGVGTAIYGLYR